MKKSLIAVAILMVLSFAVSCNLQKNDKQTNDGAQSHTEEKSDTKLTENDFKEMLFAQTTEHLAAIYTDDFNGDGITEAYAITSVKEVALPKKENPANTNDTKTDAAENTENSAENGEEEEIGYVRPDHSPDMTLWFIGGDTVQKLVSGELGHSAEIWEFSDKKLVAVKVYKNGIPSTNVFFVAGKNAYSYGEFAFELIRAGVDSNEFYALDYQQTSESEPIPYYMYFDGNFFCEYGAKEIGLEEIPVMQGANEIVTALENAGYTVDGIIKRDNGILNINITKTEGKKTVEENLTLRYAADNKLAMIPRSAPESPLKNENNADMINSIKENGFKDSSLFSYGGKYKTVLDEKLVIFEK